MRIGLLINLAPRKLGSLENWLVALCDLARRRGHTVDAYTLSPVHPQVRRDLAAMGCGLERVENLQRSWLAGVRRLASYDVLHLNLFQPRTRIALMAYAAWPARVLLCDHSSGPVPGSGPLPSLLKRCLDRVTCFRVDGLIGVSDYVRARDEARYHLDPHRARTVYNGVDVARFHPGTLPSAPPEQVTVLTVAHLIPEKGVDVLLRAFAAMEVGSARLIVVGDGPQAVTLRRLAHELGVAGRVTFAGLRDDVQLLLEQADIFVHPAIWAEAFGLTIAEAMAHARPVVASRVGGIPEIIEDPIHGRLFRPGDAEDLGRILDELARSPELRIRMGNAARERVFRQFTLDACVEGHLGWIEELARGGAQVQAGENGAAIPASAPSGEQALGSHAPRAGGSGANVVRRNEGRLDFVDHLAKNTPPAPSKPPLGA